jgi:uncharacterized protein
MVSMYHDGSRQLQAEFDTQRLADRLEQRIVRDHVTDEDRELIERLDMFFLATADLEGRPSCSYKGWDPGFVRVLDAKTLVFPNYDGNGMYISTGNLRVSPHVGLLFIDFQNPRRLRVNGTASRVEAGASPVDCHDAQFFVKIAVREVFPNCPRYIHRLSLAERSKFVPHAGVTTPIPSWKTTDWAQDVLAANDPARTANRPE